MSAVCSAVRLHHRAFADPLALLAVYRPAARPLCRHCHTGKVNRPRGLCWDCFRKPAVRGLYPPSDTGKGRRGVLGNNRFKLPNSPTNAEPGSAEKLAVMAQRALDGVSLFHPDDLRIDNVTADAGHLAAWRPSGGRFVRFASM